MCYPWPSLTSGPPPPGADHYERAREKKASGDPRWVPSLGPRNEEAEEARRTNKGEVGPASALPPLVPVRAPPKRPRMITERDFNNSGEEEKRDERRSRGAGRRKGGKEGQLAYSSNCTRLPANFCTVAAWCRFPPRDQSQGAASLMAGFPVAGEAAATAATAATAPEPRFGRTPGPPAPPPPAGVRGFVHSAMRWPSFPQRKQVPLDAFSFSPPSFAARFGNLV